MVVKTKKVAKKGKKKMYRRRAKRRGASYSTSIKQNYPSRLTLRGNIGSVFPDEYFTTLKYVSVIQFFSASGLTNQIFYGNSLYDPDYSHSLNHQPAGFDQLSALYNRYQVLGCKITAEINNNSSTVPINATLGFSAQNPVAFNDLYFPENPYTKTIAVGTASGMSSKKITSQCSIKKILGHKDIMENERTWGLCGNIGVGSNPADFVFAYLNMIADDTVSTINCYVRFTISYHARFFQKLGIPISKANTGVTGSTGATGTNIVVG